MKQIYNYHLKLKIINYQDFNTFISIIDRIGGQKLSKNTSDLNTMNQRDLDEMYRTLHEQQRIHIKCPQNIHPHTPRACAGQ